MGKLGLVGPAGASGQLFSFCVFLALLLLLTYSGPLEIEPFGSLDNDLIQQRPGDTL